MVSLVVELGEVVGVVEVTEEVTEVVVVGDVVVVMEVVNEVVNDVVTVVVVVCDEVGVVGHAKFLPGQHLFKASHPTSQRQKSVTSPESSVNSIKSGKSHLPMHISEGGVVADVVTVVVVGVVAGQRWK